MPPLNRPTVPSTLRVPSGNTMSERAPRDELRHPLQDAGAGIRAIDEQVPGPLQVPAEKRNPPERLLRDDPQLQRQRREHDRDVVDALVIRGERRSCAPDRACSSPATRTRTPVVFRISHAHARAQRWPKSPLAIEQRRDERRRAEHDRVER